MASKLSRAQREVLDVLARGGELHEYDGGIGGRWYRLQHSHPGGWRTVRYATVDALHVSGAIVRQRTGRFPHLATYVLADRAEEKP